MMVGHQTKYDDMVVIGVDAGWEAARLEGLVIGHCQRGPDGRRCMNKVADSRGCPRHAAYVFLYIVRTLPPIACEDEDIE